MATSFVEVHPGGRQVREFPHRRVLPRAVRPARHESEPGFGVVVGRARSVVRVAERVLAEPRDERERESVPAELSDESKRRLGDA
jgi:hypothetical protein